MKPTLSLSSLRQLLRSVYATRRTILYSVWWCISFATVELVWDYQSVLFRVFDSAGMIDCLLTEVLPSEHEANHELHWPGDFGEVLLSVPPSLDVSDDRVCLQAARLACATSAMLAGRSRNIVNDYGLVITSIGAVVIGVGLLVSAFTYDLAVSYVAFLSLVMINEFCYCSATAEIAMATSGLGNRERISLHEPCLIPLDCPDSLRGVALLSNTIIAMFIQTLLQFICGPQVLDVSIRTKYMTWSVFMGLLSVFMLGNLKRAHRPRVPHQCLFPRCNSRSAPSCCGPS